MTENESIKKHIEECEHRIEKILGFMESNEDANVDGCEGNIEVLKTVVIALEEIQQYRAIGTVKEIKKSFNENRKAGYKHGYSDGYAKSVDEFAEKICDKVTDDSLQVMLPDGFRADVVTVDYVAEMAWEIAEQMKGGE